MEFSSLLIHSVEVLSVSAATKPQCDASLSVPIEDARCYFNKQNLEKLS